MYRPRAHPYKSFQWWPPYPAFQPRGTWGPQFATEVGRNSDIGVRPVAQRCVWAAPGNSGNRVFCFVREGLGVVRKAGTRVLFGRQGKEGEREKGKDEGNEHDVCALTPSPVCYGNTCAVMLCLAGSRCGAPLARKQVPGFRLRRGTSVRRLRRSTARGHVQCEHGGHWK